MEEVDPFSKLKKKQKYEELIDSSSGRISGVSSGRPSGIIQQPIRQSYMPSIFSKKKLAEEEEQKEFELEMKSPERPRRMTEYGPKKEQKFSGTIDYGHYLDSLIERDCNCKGRYNVSNTWYCKTCCKYGMCFECIQKCHKNCPKNSISNEEKKGTEEGYCSCKWILGHRITATQNINLDDGKKFGDVYGSEDSYKALIQLIKPADEGSIYSEFLEDFNTLSFNESCAMNKQFFIDKELYYGFFKLASTKNSYIDYYLIGLIFHNNLSKQLFGFKRLTIDDYHGNCLFRVLYQRNFMQKKLSKDKILSNFVECYFTKCMPDYINFSGKDSSSNDIVQQSLKSSISNEEKKKIQQMRNYTITNIFYTGLCYGFFTKEHIQSIIKTLSDAILEASKDQDVSVKNIKRITKLSNFQSSSDAFNIYYYYYIVLYMAIVTLNAINLEEYIKNKLKSMEEKCAKQQFLFSNEGEGEAAEERKTNAFISMMKAILLFPVDRKRKEFIDLFKNIFFTQDLYSFTPREIDLYLTQLYYPESAVVIGSAKREIENELMESFTNNETMIYPTNIPEYLRGKIRYVKRKENDFYLYITRIDNLVMKLSEEINTILSTINRSKLPTQTTLTFYVGLWKQASFAYVDLKECTDQCIHIINQLIYNNVDEILAKVLISILFERIEVFDVNQGKGAEVIRRIENIINNCINILTFYYLSKEGREYIQQGSSLKKLFIIATFVETKPPKDFKRYSSALVTEDIANKGLSLEKIQLSAIQRAQTSLFNLDDKGEELPPEDRTPTTYIAKLNNEFIKKIKKFLNVPKIFLRYKAIPPSGALIDFSIIEVEQKFEEIEKILKEMDNTKIESLFTLIESIDTYSMPPFIKVSDQVVNLFMDSQNLKFKSTTKQKSIYISVAFKLLIAKLAEKFIAQDISFAELIIKFLKLIEDGIRDLTKEWKDFQGFQIDLLTNERQGIKDYLAALLTAIKQFFSFAYSYSNLLKFPEVDITKNFFVFYILLLKNESLFQEIVFPNKGHKLTDTEKLARLNQINYFMSQNISEKIIEFIDSFLPTLLEDITNPEQLKNRNLFDSFFESDFHSFSDIGERFHCLFQRNGADNIKEYKNEPSPGDKPNPAFKDDEISQRLSKFSEFIENGDNVESYIFNAVLDPKFQNAFAVENELEENFAESLFKLSVIDVQNITWNQEISSFTILIRILSANENFFDILEDSRWLAEKKDEVLKLMTGVKNILLLKFRAYLFYIMMYPNSKEENKLACECVTMIKFIQQLLEGFNCRFQRYIFYHEYGGPAENDDDDKEEDKAADYQPIKDEEDKKEEDKKDEEEDLITNEKPEEKKEEPPIKGGFLNLLKGTAALKKDNDENIPQTHSKKPSFLDITEQKMKEVFTKKLGEEFDKKPRYIYKTSEKEFLINEPIYYVLLSDLDPKNFRGTLFDLILKLLKIIVSFLTVRNIREIDNDIIKVDENLYIIYSAIIDLMIECLSTGNEDVLSIINEKFSKDIVKYCAGKSGIYGCFISPCLYSGSNINKDVFFKSRLFDLINTFFSTIHVYYFEYEREYKGVINKIALKYFDLLMFYVNNFNTKMENMLKENPIQIDANEEQDRGVNYTNFMRFFEKKYESYELFKDIEEFKLLEKIFTFCQIIENEYDDKSVSEMIKKYEDTSKEKKIIIYNYFNKRCKFIEFKFKLSKYLSKKIEDFKNDEEVNEDQEGAVELPKTKENLIDLLAKYSIKAVKPKKELKRINNIYFTSDCVFHNREQLMSYIRNKTDRTSHRTKIMDLIKNSNKFQFSRFISKRGWHLILFELKDMKLLNRINIIIHVLVNIVIMVIFYRHWSLEDEEYNRSAISVVKRGSLQYAIIFFLCVIHVFIQFYFIILYYFNFYKLFVFDYFDKYSQIGFLVPKMSEGSSAVTGASTKKSVQEMHRLFEKSLFATLLEIFPDVKKSKFCCFSKLYMIIYLLFYPDVFLIVLSTAFNLLFLATQSPVYLAIPIIFTFDIIPPIKNVFIGIKNKGVELATALLFNLVILYAFMWIALQAFPQLHNHSVLDFSGEPIDDDEPFCNSSLQCASIFWSQGFFEGGTFDIMPLISFKNSPYQYIGLFFYHFMAFILINTILSNVFTGSINDAFVSRREETTKIQDDKNNKCFICNLDREKAYIEGINFEGHLHDKHNFVKYIEFLIYLYSKEVNDYTLYEKLIYDQINEKDISWVPYEEEH